MFRSARCSTSKCVLCVGAFVVSWSAISVDADDPTTGECSLWRNTVCVDCCSASPSTPNLTCCLRQDDPGHGDMPAQPIGCDGARIGACRMLVMCPVLCPRWIKLRCKMLKNFRVGGVGRDAFARNSFNCLTNKLVSGDGALN